MFTRVRRDFDSTCLFVVLICSIFAEAIESGYFAWAEKPLEVFQCRGTHCPGGIPGTCEGDALGPTCDTCPDGKCLDQISFADHEQCKCINEGNQKIKTLL